MSPLNGTDPNELRLSDLYQEVILDHNKRPRNFGRLIGATHWAHGKNPLCGDDFFLDLLLDKDGKILKIGFEGSGCAISKASASMMTTQVEGKSLKETGELKDRFIHLLTDKEITEENAEKMGRLKIFQGVRQFPIRVKCATLIWRALEEALRGAKENKTEVSTE